MLFLKPQVHSHHTSILKSLHWLQINQRIEYKILSLTYKVLTTAQPGYLRNLISVDSPFIAIHSSSSVTLSRSRPSSSSSLKITDRSFRYASPCLWNKLPASFHQLNPDHSFSHSSRPNCLKLICPIITTVIVHYSYSVPLSM